MRGANRISLSRFHEEQAEQWRPGRASTQRVIDEERQRTLASVGGRSLALCQSLGQDRWGTAFAPAIKLRSFGSINGQRLLDNRAATPRVFQHAERKRLLSMKLKSSRAEFSTPCAMTSSSSLSVANNRFIGGQVGAPREYGDVRRPSDIGLSHSHEGGTKTGISWPRSAMDCFND